MTTVKGAGIDIDNMTQLDSSELQQIIWGHTDGLGDILVGADDTAVLQQLIASSQIQVQPAPMANPVTIQTQQQLAVASRQPAKVSIGKNPSQTPDGIWVEITEQPKQRGLRFRYECEGRSAGSIPGENNTAEKKTYPTIKIHNYTGTAVIVVSCVTKEQPYEPHPHNLVGRDCKRGVCTLKVKDTSVISFPHLGIQCAKKKDVEANLKQRKEINVDPFQTGFKNLNKTSNIDLNVVRLCFQVFLPDENGKITRIVPPVVSHPIHDKKSLNELVICRVDRSSGKAKGGDEVFLLCEKINRDDIGIRFYQENDQGDIIWEEYGDFSMNDIHRQYAIVFRTPPFRDTLINQPVEVKMQLKRMNDAETSDPIPFIYMPEDPDPDRILEKRKRKANQLKTLGFNMEANVSQEDIKQRLKLKATKSRIKQEAVTPEMPAYSFNNIIGLQSENSSTIIDQSDSSVNVRTLDNTTMGNVTISTSESVRQQLASLPDHLQNQLLQRLAMQKLQEEARLRQNMPTVAGNIQGSNSFLDVLTTSSPLSQATTNSGMGPIVGDVSMQQAAILTPDNSQASVDINMVQTYLGDQNVSFDSFSSLSGNMMANVNTDIDAVGAVVNVTTDNTKNLQTIDETNAAIQSLNQS